MKLLNLSAVFLFLFLVLNFSCKKKETEPQTVVNSFEVITKEIFDLDHTIVGCGGEVKIVGEVSIWSVGLCWNISGEPNLDDYYKSALYADPEDYSITLYGLEPNTTYFIRAYAIDIDFDMNYNTEYGEEVIFTTPELPIFIDLRDGHEYKYIQIGAQYWMAENLAWLPNVSPTVQDTAFYVYGYFGSDVIEAKALENYKIYGVLYNHAAANICCPEGWRLPTEDDWNELFNFISNTNDGEEGDALKSKGIIEEGDGLWAHSTSEFFGKDAYGFKGLPGGLRSEDDFYFLNQRCYCKTYNSGRIVMLTHDSHNIDYFSLPDLGYSVRCIKDN